MCQHPQAFELTSLSSWLLFSTVKVFRLFAVKVFGLLSFHHSFEFLVLIPVTLQNKMIHCMTNQQK